MYFVDIFIGLELYKMLQDTAYLPINTTSDNTTYQPAISLVMHPAVGGFPSAWEFTLIIVVALLAISFLASGNNNVICLYPANSIKGKTTANVLLSLSLFLLYTFYNGYF